MAIFAGAEEVYDCIGRVFELAVVDPAFVEATHGSDLVVKLSQTDPPATILIDFPNQKVSYGDAAAGVRSTVDLRMSSDDSHRFWLGKLNFTLALAQRRVRMEGSRTKAMKLLPLTKPLFAAYEQLLRDAGREDLLI